MTRHPRWIVTALVTTTAAVGLLLGSGPAGAQAVKGPSSSAAPYMVSVDPAVSTRSLLTVGDAVNNKPDGTPYRMAGIPDGLGAFENGDGTFTVLMNHEIAGTLGAERAHGAKGAFVSKWTIRKSDWAVLAGEDLIKQVAVWDPATSAYRPLARGVLMSRFCSADLPPVAAFFNQASGLGYNGRIFMNGEESGPESRAFAHLLNGDSYELPRLGKFSWENALANAATGDKTVVIGTDDSGGGQIYLYVGTKTNSGSPVDRAGLTNGSLYGMQIAGLTTEADASVVAPGTAVTFHNFGDVSNGSGARLEADSTAAGVTKFQRPEDGVWDPMNPSDFYFVTTASMTTMSRLWRVRFADITNPQNGARVDLLLDGSEGHKMLDNMTMNRSGQVLIQEDPGGNDRLAQIWRYNVATDQLAPMAQHDPALFGPAASPQLTRDEESSGIIDISEIMGDGWYLLDVQAHYPTDAELVEGGQLLALYFPSTNNYRVGLPLATR